MEKTVTADRQNQTAKVTTVTFREMKQRGEKIAVLTAYDHGTVQLLNEAGIDAVLVGDSLGMVKLGYESTIPVTMDDMLYHCKIARRANTRSLLIVDMPFMSYESGADDAIRNAGLLIKSGGAEAVKLEGGMEIADTVRALVSAKIPVMGHLGLMPQSVHLMGGYKVQGRGPDTAEKLLEAAAALEAAGVFSIVLECVPGALAARVTKQCAVPVIGIGAGPECDGQVLVTDDMLGLFTDLTPRFVKRYATLRAQMQDAFRRFREEVRAGDFPGKDQTFK